MKTKRNKAWLGAVIGAVGGIAGGLLGASASKKAANRQYELQKEQWETSQKLQNRKDTLAEAQNLSNRYSNQDYVDDLKNRITFKNGGKMNKVNFNKRFKCGGRKKAANGIDWNNVGKSAIDAFGTIGQAIISADTQNYISNKQRNWNVESSNNGVQGNNVGDKFSLKLPSYIDRNSYYKCGGRKRRK